MPVGDIIQKALHRCTVRFAKSEDGAVSVDWVVLTAAIVGVAAVAATTVQDSVVALGGSVETELGSTEMGVGN